MTALLLLALAPAPAEGYEVIVRHGEHTHRLGLVIDTAEGNLAAREAKLLAGWKPSADGSDPLDRLLPDGRLLHVEVVAVSPHAGPITRALFAALDRDGNGMVTPGEFKAVEATLLKRFDADEDGCLTALEIVPDLLTIEPKFGKPAGLSVSVVHPNESALRGGTGRPSCVARLVVNEAKRCTARDGELLFDLASTWPTDLPATPRGLLRSGREKERNRFEQVARAVVTLTVRPQARGWFEILDADGDGQVSPRELRTAWDRLADTDAKKAGFLIQPDFAAPVVSLTVSAGLAPSPAVVLIKNSRQHDGPTWFVAMDRNGDGDLSPEEFLGTEKEFKARDADGDGLISVVEAKSGDRVRKERGPK